MRSSALLVLSAAAAAFAGPVAVDKRALYTEWDVVYKTVTVTAGQEPSQTPTPAPAAPIGDTVVVAPKPPVVYQPAPAPAPAPTTSTPPPASTYVPSGGMQGAALHHHNIHRANHSCPDMTWNEEVASYAQVAADSCVFKHQMDIGKGNYGQNLAMWGTSSNAAALGEDGAISMATSDMWYNGEFNSYAPYFGKEPSMNDFSSWGHISQLLWAESTGLGCAVKLCEKGTMYPTMDAWFMVCNYYPAGNVGGNYAKNVKAPLGEAPVTA